MPAGGDGEAPLTLPPHIRIAAETMHRAGKPVFCEFLSSFGCVYADDPNPSTHHRLIYSYEFVPVAGLTRGDVLDDHYNEILPYYFVPSCSRPILTYHSHICAHDSPDMESEVFKGGRRGLWSLDPTTLMASFRLCNYNRARPASMASWRAVIAFVVSFLAGEVVEPVFPTPVCMHKATATVESIDDVREAVEKGLSWFRRAEILIDEGKRGVREGLSHHISARDGHQLGVRIFRLPLHG